MAHFAPNGFRALLHKLLTKNSVKPTPLTVKCDDSKFSKSDIITTKILRYYSNKTYRALCQPLLSGTPPVELVYQQAGTISLTEEII